MPHLLGQTSTKDGPELALNVDDVSPDPTHCFVRERVLAIRAGTDTATSTIFEIRSASPLNFENCGGYRACIGSDTEDGSTSAPVRTLACTCCPRPRDHRRASLRLGPRKRRNTPSESNTLGGRYWVTRGSSLGGAASQTPRLILGGLTPPRPLGWGAATPQSPRR